MRGDHGFDWADRVGEGWLKSLGVNGAEDAEAREHATNERREATFEEVLQRLRRSPLGFLKAELFKLYGNPAAIVTLVILVVSPVSRKWPPDEVVDSATVCRLFAVATLLNASLSCTAMVPTPPVAPAIKTVCP